MIAWVTVGRLRTAAFTSHLYRQNLRYLRNPTATHTESVMTKSALSAKFIFASFYPFHGILALPKKPAVGLHDLQNCEVR